MYRKKTPKKTRCFVRSILVALFKNWNLISTRKIQNHRMWDDLCIPYQLCRSTLLLSHANITNNLSITCWRTLIKINERKSWSINIWLQWVPAVINKIIDWIIVRLIYMDQCNCFLWSAQRCPKAFKKQVMQLNAWTECSLVEA